MIPARPCATRAELAAWFDEVAAALAADRKRYEDAVLAEAFAEFFAPFVVMTIRTPGTVHLTVTTVRVTPEDFAAYRGRTLPDVRR